MTGTAGTSVDDRIRGRALPLDEPECFVAAVPDVVRRRVPAALGAP